VFRPKKEEQPPAAVEAQNVLPEKEEENQTSDDVRQGIVDDKITSKGTTSSSGDTSNVESDFLTQQGQEALAAWESLEDTEMDIKFGISAKTIESYANNLDYTEYLVGSGDYEEFRFSYAPNLYNDVTMGQDYIQREFGMNLRRIHFSGSAGSELTYTISERNDTLSTEDMTHYVHSTVYAKYILPEDIIFSAKEDEGKVIVTGWNNSAHEKAVYHLIKITDRFVMEMQVVFPNYTSEEDQLQKAYVTECYYRMCGFSGSSASPRTYSEFWEASQ
jgi:hypothetical protein